MNLQVATMRIHMYKSYDTFSANAESATVTTAAIIAGNDSRIFSMALHLEIVYSIIHGLRFGDQHIPHLLKLLRKLLRGQDAGLVLLNDGVGLASPGVEQP